MGFSCCAPNCRSNYNKMCRVSIFKFPSDERMQYKWTQALKRENTFKITKNTRVCIKHFEEKDIIREEFCRPKLKAGAVPSILAICPKYLTSFSTNRDRPSQEKTIARWDQKQMLPATSDCLNTHDEYVRDHYFSTFLEFLNCYSHLNVNFRVPNQCWEILKCETKIIFFRIEPDPIPKIINSVVVDDTLTLRVFNRDRELYKVGARVFPVKVDNIKTVEDILKVVYREKDKAPSLMTGGIANLEKVPLDRATLFKKGERS